MDRKQQIAADLDEARRRTLALLAPLDDERMTTQYDQLMSPPVWDYAHIGVFEELWLVQRLSGAPPMDEELMVTYDAIETPRVVRGRRELLDRPRAAAYVNKVREKALALLEEVDLDGEDPLLRDGFVYDLILQHEHQHDETILQTIQLTPGRYREALPALPDAPAGLATSAEMVTVPAGRYPIGSDVHEPYDNEHGRHEVELAAFEIDRFPVTNGAFQEFIADRGYEREELWSRDGWEWRFIFGVQAPEYWRWERPCWLTTRYGHVAPVDPRLPVSHVSYFEAEAFARWAGKRLPTEREWEVAAAWDPAAGRAAATRGATSRPRRSTPTWTRTSWARPPSARTRAAPARSAASRCWATSGSGRAATSSRTRASGRSRTRSTRPRSGAPRSRCCAAARGRRGRGWPGTRFATGTRG